MKNLLLATLIGIAALLVGGAAAAVIAVALVTPAATALAA